MKTETPTLLGAPPWSPIRGRIVGRLELLFVRDRGSGRTHRRLVGRYDLSGIELRDRELAVPAFEAAWAGACRVAKRIQIRQLREERGNAAAAAIQEARRREAGAARLAAGIKPEINLTIKREWLDAILYRGKREESLQRLARKMAAKVVKYKKNLTLEPMNAYERHVIHATLQDFPNVTTYSTGTEPNRRVIVAYVKEEQ